MATNPQTASTLIRDLSAVSLLHNTDKVSEFVFALDTTNGLNNAFRTQKISLKDVRDYVLGSANTTYKTVGLATNDKDLAIATGGSRVGIGTINPKAKLHVSGDVSTTGAISAQGQIFGPAGRVCFRGNADTASEWYDGITVTLAGQFSGACPPKALKGDSSVAVSGGIKPNTITMEQMFTLGTVTAGSYTLPNVTVTDKGIVTHITNVPLRGHVYSVSSGNNLQTVLSAGVVVDSQVAADAAIVDTKLDTIKTSGKILNSATTANSDNVANAIVTRDAAGDFSANKITAPRFEGNAATADWFFQPKILYWEGDVQGTLNDFTGQSASYTTQLAIKSNAVVTDKINGYAVTTGKIDTAAVTNEKIAVSAVQTTQIADLNVTTAKLANEAVTDVKLANAASGNSGRAVGADHIKTDAVQTSKVKDLNITTSKLADDAVTDDKLSHTPVAPGQWGGATATPQFTVNQQGRIIQAAQVTIQPWYEQHPVAGGDLDGTYPNPQIKAGVIVNADVHSNAEIADTKLATIATGGKVANSATTATSTNAASTIMSRDSSGNSTINKLTAYDDVIVSSSSDINFKDNVNKLTGCLSKLDGIRGVEYDWNDKQDSYKGHDVGVIAQEVEQMLPEAAVTRENGSKAVRYERLIPVLIEAIKELQARVVELENK